MREEIVAIDEVIPVELVDYSIQGTAKHSESPTVALNIKTNISLDKASELVKNNNLFLSTGTDCDYILEDKKPAQHLFGGNLSDYFGQQTYIKKIIYKNLNTIVIWNDGSKTTAKCADDDCWSGDAGLMVCVLKKLLGGEGVRKLFCDWGIENCGMPNSVIDPGHIDCSLTLSDVRQINKFTNTDYKEAKEIPTDLDINSYR